MWFALEAAPPVYTAGLPGLCALNNYSAVGMYPDDDNCRMLYLEKVLNDDDLGVRTRGCRNKTLHILFRFFLSSSSLSLSLSLQVNEYLIVHGRSHRLLEYRKTSDIG